MNGPDWTTSYRDGQKYYVNKEGYGWYFYCNGTVKGLNASVGVAVAVVIAVIS